MQSIAHNHDNYVMCSHLSEISNVNCRNKTAIFATKSNHEFVVLLKQHHRISKVKALKYYTN